MICIMSIYLFLNLNDCNLYFFNNKIIKPYLKNFLAFNV